jgi:LmbE family N-acetylglucosaminyl deacetylase
METVVFFHAHPDDEVILTGGTIARLADEGVRVVLVVATNGDHGDVPEDLAHDETVIDRRRRETERSAAVLGARHVLWLGYADSGMTGWAENEAPECFWKTDVEEAGRRLAKILAAEHADALVIYDWHGVYGHPDHVQVHRVGTRAAEIAGTSPVLEATMNRTLLIEYAEKLGDDFDPSGPADDGNPFGTLEEELHWGVDVGPYLGRKREALACHASQVSDAGEMLKMPDDVFAVAFGTEWYREPGREAGLQLAWPFARPAPTAHRTPDVAGAS